MGKSRPRRRNPSECQKTQVENFTIEPIDERRRHQRDQSPAHEHHLEPLSSSSSPPITAPVLSFNPTIRGNSKWIAKNLGESSLEHQFLPESEAGSSRIGEKEGGEGLHGGGLSEEKLESDSCAEESKVEAGEGTQRGDGLSEDVEGLLMRRLEELRLGAKEVELTEEEWRINNQLQEDEFLVMKSICGENIHVLDKWRGLRSLQIHIHVEIPGELTVYAQINAANDRKLKSTVVDEFSYSFNVHHLPPIVLTCLFPRSYPSHSPPLFTISVQWLDSTRISSLCSMLDLLWCDHPSQEIMYHWVEWLHNCSLSYLGFGDGVTLGPYGMENAADRRAISGSMSPEIDIPSMKSYSEEK